MSEVKDRPTFRIVEHTPFVIDYEAFLEDFKNPHMTIDELREKYNFTTSTWNEYRRRALDDLGLKRKPCYTYGNLTYIKEPKYTPSYIQKKSNGYIIVKKFNKRPKYFGRYADYDTAKMVRDKLLDCEWDFDVGRVLKDKYGINRKEMPSMERAKELYSEFKDLYFHSLLEVKDICKEFGISQRTYKYLLEMVRNETGVMHRPSYKQRSGL